MPSVLCRPTPPYPPTLVAPDPLLSPWLGLFQSVTGLGPYMVAPSETSSCHVAHASTPPPRLVPALSNVIRKLLCPRFPETDPLSHGVQGAPHRPHSTGTRGMVLPLVPAPHPHGGPTLAVQPLPSSLPGAAGHPEALTLCCPGPAGGLSSVHRLLEKPRRFPVSMVTCPGEQERSMRAFLR